MAPACLPCCACAALTGCKIAAWLGLYGWADWLLCRLVTRTAFRSFLHAAGELQDLIRQLLRPEPERRLGNLAGGAADVMAHPFFADVDWDALLSSAHSAVIWVHLH